MSLFSPIPLSSSSRRTKLLDLETNLRRIVALIGGTAYTAGASTGVMPGALGSDNIKESPWLSNARKSEPYSYLIFRGTISELTGAGSAQIAIPGVGFIKDAIAVEYGIVASECSVANFSGSLAISICGTAMPTMTITTLASGVLLTQSCSSGVWTPDETVAGNFINATLTVSGAGTIVSDVIIQVVLKAKHIA